MLAELKQLTKNILMCYEFILILVQIMIFGTLDTILLPFCFLQVGREQWSLAPFLVALLCRVTLWLGPSHEEPQHSSSEISWSSVEGYITILTGALTKPCWDLPHWFCSLLCNNPLLWGERISHALLIFFPSSTYYFTFFTGIKKWVIRVQALLKTRAKFLSESWVRKCSGFTQEAQGWRLCCSGLNSGYTQAELLLFYNTFLTCQKVTGVKTPQSQSVCGP